MTGEGRDVAGLPSWLAASQDFCPPSDRDGFLTRTFLQLASLLAQLRLDGGVRGPLAPSGVVALLVALALVLMVSLARNFAFVALVLAGMLVRACVLPVRALRRLASVVGIAALLTLLAMLPATLMGQAQAPLLLATKVLVTVGVTMEMALTTPVGELVGALRRLHVPSVAILAVELTLRSVVSLGTIAQAALTALRLRSVGANADKAQSLAGVAGVTLLRAARTAEQTYDAMRCRGFVGTYEVEPGHAWRAADACWVIIALLALVLFVYLHRGA